MRKKVCVDTRVSEGEGRGALDARADSPAAHEEDHSEAAVPMQPYRGAEVHLQPLEVHDGADIHLEPMDDSKQGDTQRRL